MLIWLGDYILRNADVLVIKDRSFDLFDHYLVYIGNGRFIANMSGGIRIIDIVELKNFEGKYYAVRLRIFVGNELERTMAIRRANDCLQPKYSMLYSNCEHFANFVQFGKRQSLQSTKASIALIAAGAFASKESKSEPVQAIGALSILAGVVGLLNEAFGNNDASRQPYTYLNR